MIPVEIDRLQDERQKQMVTSSCLFKVSSKNNFQQKCKVHKFKLFEFYLLLGS